MNIAPIKALDTSLRATSLKAAALFFAPLLFLATAKPAPGADFPPVSEAHKSLTKASWDTRADAVYLYKNAELWLFGTELNSWESRMVVEGRVKILDDDAKDLGDLEIYANDFVRLRDLEARTIKPDGTVVEADADDIFRRTLSERNGATATRLVFPAVEKGAILDYRYEIRIPTILFLDPWYFQDRLPVQTSTIIYHIPKDLSVRTWGKENFGRRFEQSSEREALSNRVTMRMTQLPGIPEETYGLPFADIACQFLVVPTKYGGTLLLDTWASTVDLVREQIYDDLRKKSGLVKAKAKELANAQPDKNPVALATAAFDWVRESVELVGGPNAIPIGESLDEIVREGRSNSAGRAFLLLELLQNLKLDVDLLWADDRRNGLIDPDLPNPVSFDGLLVRLKSPSGPFYLALDDDRHPAGYLPWYNEGTKALRFHKRRPEIEELPERPASANRSVAHLDLTIDEAGALEGDAKITFEGHPAGRPVGGGGDGLDSEAWTEHLGQRHPGFEILEATAERLGADRIELRYRLRQKEEEVLGDEVSLAPSRPFGPLSQLLTVPISQRRTPVRIAYPESEEVKLVLRYPEGWQIDAQPADQNVPNAAGAYETRLEAAPEERTMTIHRRFVTGRRDFLDAPAYTALRDLYSTAEKGDAQALALSLTP